MFDLHQTDLNFSCHHLMLGIIMFVGFIDIF